MDREAEQLLVHFPGPIRFLLSRPRNRLVMILDLIRMPLFFFLMALTTSQTPGWLSWLPFWIVSLFLFGMVLMSFLCLALICFSWLSGGLSFRVCMWSFLGMFLIVEGSHSEPKWNMFYFSIVATIVFTGAALPGLMTLLTRPGCLVLDQQGFEIEGFWSKTRKVQWANARNFAVGTKSGLVVYEPAVRDDTTIGKLRKLLGNPKAHLPSIDGFTPNSLASFMTQWRERALNN
jgi:hypothetical protein